MMPAPVPKSSGVVIPQRLPWHRQVLASAIALFYWLSIKSWRRIWKDIGDNSNTKAPVIFCIWHNHLILAIASYDDHVSQKWQEKGLVTMVSASGDGAILAAVLDKFGVHAIRGSTSRRGPQALLEATSIRRLSRQRLIWPRPCTTRQLSISG